MDNNDIESLQIEINGQRAHYLKAGSGPPVVLVHGGASDSRDWINTMTALGGRYTFYAPDLIGYGQSERRASGYYLSEFSDFLAGFIETLKLDRPALAGHSLGGRFCLDVAIRDQRKVSKLVLIDTTGLGKMSIYGNVLQFIFWGIRKVLRQPQPYPNFRVKKGESFHRSYAEDLRRLTIPTLLVWKRRDPYLPVALARQAEKLIPNVKLAVVEGYGHAPHQKDSEAFNRIFLEFLGDKKPS